MSDVTTRSHPWLYGLLVFSIGLVLLGVIIALSGLILMAIGMPITAAFHVVNPGYYFYVAIAGAMYVLGGMFGVSK